MKLTQARVKELFDYDPLTGGLIWKVARGKSRKGKVAGCNLDRGYKQVTIYGERYYLHRLIWFWHHGYFPEHQIDHINKNKTDNHIENLREVTQSCNMRNTNIYNTNTSGITGVSYCKARKRWKAAIKIEYLGSFKTFPEAVRARYQAEIAHKWPGCNDSTPAAVYMANL